MRLSLPRGSPASRLRPAWPWPALLPAAAVPSAAADDNVLRIGTLQDLDFDQPVRDDPRSSATRPSS